MISQIDALRNSLAIDLEAKYVEILSKLPESRHSNIIQFYSILRTELNNPNISLQKINNIRDIWDVAVSIQIEAAAAEEYLANLKL